MLKKLILAGAASIAFASAASAASISFTDTGGGIDPWNDTLVLGLFDTNLGTLTAVTITIDTSTEGTVTVTNTSTTANADVESYRIRSRITVDLPAGATYDTVSTPASAILVGPILAPAGVFNSPSGGGNAQSILNVAAVDFNSFSLLGGGALNVPVSGIPLSFATVTGPSFTATSSTASAARVTIEYTYDTPTTQTPEPASMALLGAGLVGLGLARRRKAA